MAPLRQKLIHGLACVVAIDLAIAGVVIDARSDSASASSSAAPKAPVASHGSILPGPGSGGGGGILGAAQFRHRRNSAGGSTVTTAGGSSQVAAGLPGSSAGTSSSVTTGPASSSTTGSTRSRPTGGSGSTGPAGQSGRSTAPTTGVSGPADSPAGATADPGVGGDGSSVPSGDTGSPSGDNGTPSGGGTTPTTGSGSVQPTGKPPAKGPASQTVSDPTGDTTSDGTGNTMAQPQADIVRAQANWSAKAVVFAVQVAQPVNPGQDKNWAGDSTYIDWMLDTNGDGGPDFEVQYFFDPKGGLVADVSKAGDTSGTSACPAEAGYTADGYTVAIDPACLGNPATVAFRVTTYYDPDPANPNGSLATDTSPDGGYSGPISKP